MRPPQSSADAPPGAEAGTGDAGTSEAYDFITQVRTIHSKRGTKMARKKEHSFR